MQNTSRIRLKFVLPLVMLIAPLPAIACAELDLDQLLATPAEQRAETVAALRDQGPELLDWLLAEADRMREAPEEGDAVGDVVNSDRHIDQWVQLERWIDDVGGQRYCTTSRLFWFTDIEQARTEAARTGKPILSLRMLGKLTDEYSCANSRFFRTTLYANEDISAVLRNRFVLHWKSVRPVPRVTVDFGDGRKLERTITGNSAHHLLDEFGRPLDVLPGLYGPAAFLEWLNRAIELADNMKVLQGIERTVYLRNYHAERSQAILTAWNDDLSTVAPVLTLTRNDANLPEENAAGSEIRVESAVAPVAIDAAALAITKRRVETPLIRSITSIDAAQPAASATRQPATALEEQTTDALWARVAELHADQAQLDDRSFELIASQNPTAAVAMKIAVTKAFVESPLMRMVHNLEKSIALDTVQNEYRLHRQIHDWFATGHASTDVDALNERVYAELFLTPSSDPWLGLVPAGTYSALENDGVTIDHKVGSASLPDVTVVQ